MGPVLVNSSLRRKPEPRFRPLVDRLMTLDSGLRRKDVQGIPLCPDIFEHRLLGGVFGHGPLNIRVQAEATGRASGQGLPAAIQHLESPYGQMSLGESS
jgi:hypothetical protein